ncbi:hypothetical protein F4811DRAFT_574387 [Daldinia bambusicola]|nr:hypothetical protein F4811DRAFT_574387 [Daldinia bambusicola]
MCLRRRVFWSCLHEDVNVTPPPPLLYCEKAMPKANGGGGGSDGGDADGTSTRRSNRKPCASINTLPLTGKSDFIGGVVRPERCELCIAMARTIAPVEDKEKGKEKEKDTRRIPTNPDGPQSAPVPPLQGEEEEEEEGVEENKKTHGDVDMQWAADWMAGYPLLPEAPWKFGGTDNGEGWRSGSTASGVGFGDAGLAASGADFQLFDDNNDNNDDYSDGDCSGWLMEYEMHDIAAKNESVAPSSSSSSSSSS